MIILYKEGQTSSNAKQSNYKPWQALRFPEVWGSQILRQSAHEGGKVVSPKHRPPLSPGNIPGTHFCKRLSRPQGHSAAGRIMSMKNSNYTIGNRSRDLPVCSAVPQQLRHRVPPLCKEMVAKSEVFWYYIYISPVAGLLTHLLLNIDQEHTVSAETSVSFCSNPG
jgi:hypothetical protein